MYNLCDFQDDHELCGLLKFCTSATLPKVEVQEYMFVWGEGERGGGPTCKSYTLNSHTI